MGSLHSFCQHKHQLVSLLGQWCVIIILSICQLQRPSQRIVDSQQSSPNEIGSIISIGPLEMLRQFPRERVGQEWKLVWRTVSTLLVEFATEMLFITYMKWLWHQDLSFNQEIGAVLYIHLSFTSQRISGSIAIQRWKVTTSIREIQGPLLNIVSEEFHSTNAERRSHLSSACFPGGIPLLPLKNNLRACVARWATFSKESCKPHKFILNYGQQKWGTVQCGKCWGPLLHPQHHGKKAAKQN